MKQLFKYFLQFVFDSFLNSINIKAVSDAEEKDVECPVCFEYFALSNVTFCAASSGTNGNNFLEYDIKTTYLFPR